MISLRINGIAKLYTFKIEFSYNEKSDLMKLTFGSKKEFQDALSTLENKTRINYSHKKKRTIVFKLTDLKCLSINNKL